MSNILTVPASGAIYFDGGGAGSSTTPDLTGSAVSLSYDGNAGLNITSYNALSTDRFSVDGSNGRLFSISDSLTGTIFSVNDAAGLPIIEVESDTIDTVTIGTYGTNAFVVKDDKVGIGTATPNEKLTVVGNISASGNVNAATADIPIITSDVIMNGTENTMPNQTLDGGDASIMTKKLSEDLYGWKMVSMVGQRVATYALNGGSSSVGDNGAQLLTGTAGGGSVSGFATGTTNNAGFIAYRGGKDNILPFDKRVRARFLFNNFNSMNGDATFWFWIGKNTDTQNTQQPLTNGGVGLRISNSDNVPDGGNVTAVVHNGTNFVYGNISENYDFSRYAEVMLDYYGGNTNIYVNDVLASTVIGNAVAGSGFFIAFYVHSAISNGPGNNYARVRLANYEYLITDS